MVPHTSSGAVKTLMELTRTAQSHRIVRMCLASLAQIVGGVAATSDSCTYDSILSDAAQLAAHCLSGDPRADDWLVLSSQSGLFCVRITMLQRTLLPRTLSEHLQ